MGQIRKLPWEFRDEVVLRQVMTLSLSFDHRVVDGEQGPGSSPIWAWCSVIPGRLLASPEIGRQQSIIHGV